MRNDDGWIWGALVLIGILALIVSGCAVCVDNGKRGLIDDLEVKRSWKG